MVRPNAKSSAQSPQTQVRAPNQEVASAIKDPGSELTPAQRGALTRKKNREDKAKAVQNNPAPNQPEVSAQSEPEIASRSPQNIAYMRLHSSLY